MKFKDFADATTVLSKKLKQSLEFDKSWQILAAGVLAQPIGMQLATELGLEVNVAEVTRSFDDHGYQKTPEIKLPQQLSSNLIVCDVGVETGKTASLMAEKLRAALPGRQLALAVLVLPKELEPVIRQSYDQHVAARTPMVRRSLRWEFEEFG